MTDPFARLVAALVAARVRFVVVGAWGANYYARSSAIVLTTVDRDLFLPADAHNLLRAWGACSEVGLELRAQGDPLDYPRDLLLAERVVAAQGLTTATGALDLRVDLALVMGSLRFEEVWSRRRTFHVDDIEIPVASLADILVSKEQVGRDKDRLFLATWAEELRQFLESEPGRDRPSGDDS